MNTSNASDPEVKMDKTAPNPAPEKSQGQNEAPTVDDQFQQFLNPMFGEMEEQVKKTEAMIDEINAKLEADRQARYITKVTSHIPEPLKGNGQDLANVLKMMEDSVSHIQEDEENAEATETAEKTESAEEKKEAELREIDKNTHGVLVAHSMAAYLTGLKEDHTSSLCNKFRSDCKMWLSRLFRFSDSDIVYHNDVRDGLVKICRLALHQKYPKYHTEGFEALYSRPPVIYISAAASPRLGGYICTQLGLPLSCISSVPCNTVFGSCTKMDVALLEKLIEDDIAAAKTPVLLLGFAGTPTAGHVDRLGRLQDMCKKYAIWLHIEGNYLASMVMYSVPHSVASARSGDSITLTLSKWLGIPGLPYITLYKSPDESQAERSGLREWDPQSKLQCLPVWVCLQTLGHEGILSRVKHSVKVARDLYSKISSIRTIKIVSEDKKERKDIKSISDLITQAISALVIFELDIPTVVFKYCDITEQEAVPPVALYAVGSNMRNGPDSEEEKDKEETRKIYFDSLNSWLAETLRLENPKVPVDAVEVGKEGICVRFSALETVQVLGTSEEDMTAFVKSLKSHLDVLDATVLKRTRFRLTVEKNANLRVVDISNWAGLGAVQYIPDSLLNMLDSLPETGRNEIDTINIELVHKLKSTDTAFSLGHTETETACVRFGLITPETEINELVDLVAKTGKEIEESSKYLEAMSEMIMKGITEANEELKREQTVKLQTEGALRQVPLVNSLINWLSPPQPAMKGRSFNLQSGKIASTETTYKYHIQLQESALNPSTSNDIKATDAQKPKSILKSPSKELSPHTRTAGAVKAGIVFQTEETNSTAETQETSSDKVTEGIEVAKDANTDS